MLDLAGLRIEAHPRPSYFDRWFNCRIAVTAHPFAGVLETIFTDEDVRHEALSTGRDERARLRSVAADRVKLEAA